MKTSAELKEQLGQISSAMARVHKTIMENEMELRELKTMKPLGPNERLQVLLNDPEFAWLRSLSQLMSTVDEVYFQKEPIENDQVEVLKKSVNELLIQVTDTPFSKKYRSLIPVVPDLMLHHGLLKQALN
tara:strand:+ start:18879 stop:19268 length:390 start_codon:yes stop_codon:yes gene_type:complete